MNLPYMTNILAQTIVEMRILGSNKSKTSELSFQEFSFWEFPEKQVIFWEQFPGIFAIPRKKTTGTEGPETAILRAFSKIVANDSRFG